MFVVPQTPKYRLLQYLLSRTAAGRATSCKPEVSLGAGEGRSVTERIEAASEYASMEDPVVKLTYLFDDFSDTREKECTHGSRDRVVDILATIDLPSTYVLNPVMYSTRLMVNCYFQQLNIHDAIIGNHQSAANIS